MPPRKHQTWLHKLFNSKYFDTWLSISYMFRYPDTGIHHYICNKLRRKRDISTVLPQLIHIMFFHSESPFPIFNLLEKISNELGIKIYFLLNACSVDGMNECVRVELMKCVEMGCRVYGGRSYYYFVDRKCNKSIRLRVELDKLYCEDNKCVDNNEINNEDNKEDNNNEDNKEVSNIINNKEVNNKEDNNINNEIKENTFKIQENSSLIEFNDETLINSVEIIDDKIIDNKNITDNKAIHKQTITDNKSIIDNKIIDNKSIINNKITINKITDNKSITDNNKIKRIFMFNKYLKLLKKQTNSQPTINSMLLTLIKSISWPFHPLPLKLKEYESVLQFPRVTNTFNNTLNNRDSLNNTSNSRDILNNRDTFNNRDTLNNRDSLSNSLNSRDILNSNSINSNKSTNSNNLSNNYNSFNKTVNFIKKLVKINSTLKTTPRANRLSILKIECAALQPFLVHKIANPFNKHYFLTRVCVDECTMLCSAHNAPFIVVFLTSKHNQVCSVEMKKEAELAILLKNEMKIENLEMKSVFEKIEEIDFSFNVYYFDKKINMVEDDQKINIVEDDQKINMVEDDDERNIVDDRKINIVEDDQKIDVVDDDEKINVVVDDDKTKTTKTTNISKTTEVENKISFIVKSGPDFKQELLAYQILTEIKKIWIEEGVSAWINSYEIYVISRESGLVEIVSGKSVHNIKKEFGSLKGFYGGLSRANFLHSLVGYSVITYILQLKDRHNGNILVDGEGHVVHVDFGFILGEHPGFYLVETAPFKFSAEYLDLIDLAEFRSLFFEAFSVLRKHADRIVSIVEMLVYKGEIRCVNWSSVGALRDRFKLELGNEELKLFVDGVVDGSVGSVMTGFYDSFQYYSNGYF